MAEVPALTAAGTLDGSEQVHVIQSGNSRKATLDDILAVSHPVAMADVTGLVTALADKLDDSQAGAGGLSVLGAANAAAVRAAAGVVIGTDVQAYDATLAALAALSWTSGTLVLTLTAADTFTLKTVGSSSGNILDKAAGDALYKPLTGSVTSQSGTSYTAVLGDAETYIRFTNGSAISFTIPPNSSVAFPVGTLIEMEQAGAGALSLVAGSGVTINSRGADLTLAGQYAVAAIKKVATDTWTLTGDL